MAGLSAGTTLVLVVFAIIQCRHRNRLDFTRPDRKKEGPAGQTPLLPWPMYLPDQAQVPGGQERGGGGHLRPGRGRVSR
jgi:hypothetical protein